MNTNRIRRRFIKAVIAAPLLAPFRLAAKQNQPTPRQTAGPFYPDDLPKTLSANSDADLVKTLPDAPSASGEKLRLSGKVVTREGLAISNANIEIWQCDATGHYHHPADRPSDKRDDNFQGYGQTTTDEFGHYEFLTIVPVPYPGRTPHIHIAVSARAHRRLTTQMYISGARGNDRDGLYQRLTTEEQRALTVTLKPDEKLTVATDLGRGKQAYFKIILA